MNLTEQVQYKAALIVSGCWQGTCRAKLYDELGWESLSERCARRLTMFYKISNGMAPSYLSDHIRMRSLINDSLRRDKKPHLFPGRKGTLIAFFHSAETNGIT